MKYFSSLLTILLIVCNISFGQKVTVEEIEEIINKVPRTGLATILDLDKKFVDKLWSKHLKKYGSKVSSSKGVYTIESVNISGISNRPIRVISGVKSTGKGMRVWWVLDLGDSYVTKSENKSAYNAAEKILHDFGVKAYREYINIQIEDAEKLLGKMVKKYEKEVKEGIDLQKSVERNKDEKIRLENAIVKNEDDLEQLLKDIEQNKKDQLKSNDDVEKMKGSVERVKAKLAKVY